VTSDVDTVGGLCTRHPLALPVLQQLGIVVTDPAAAVEACCQASGVATANLVAAIAAAEEAAAADWSDRTIDATIDQVVRVFHRPMAHERALLDAALRAAHDATPSATWSVLRDELAELYADLDHHIEMEERVVFPWLRERTGAAASAIRALQLEHGDVIAHLLAIEVQARRGLAEDPTNACGAVAVGALHRFTRWLCEHIQVEAHALFVQAMLARR
jgi:iron-sulfur cluster repair protein YtfE (RIC family)